MHWLNIFADYPNRIIGVRPLPVNGETAGDIILKLHGFKRADNFFIPCRIFNLCMPLPYLL
jgi:hypothetical protein